MSQTLTSHANTSGPPPVPRARRVGRRVVLGLITLLVGALTGGAVEALIVDRDGGIHLFHHASHVVWLALLVWLPYLLQWRRPERRIALWQAAAVAAVLVPVGGLAAGVTDPAFYVAFPLFACLVALTHPVRRRLLHTGGISPVMLPLAAIAAVPSVLYAVAQLDLQQAMADDVHGVLTHYAGQAMVVLFAVVFAAVAALRAPGWQWTAGLAAGAGTVLGAASLVDTGQSGAWPAATSVGVLVLSAAYAGAAVWEHRRG